VSQVFSQSPLSNLLTTVRLTETHTCLNCYTRSDHSLVCRPSHDSRAHWRSHRALRASIQYRKGAHRWSKETDGAVCNIRPFLTRFDTNIQIGQQHTKKKLFTHNTRNLSNRNRQINSQLGPLNLTFPFPCFYLTQTKINIKELNLWRLMEGGIDGQELSS
jgi:hypothetical protein